MSAEISRPGSRDDPAFDPAELAAAEWLVLHDRGLTDAQTAEFTSWLQANERHGRLFARLEKTWDILDRVPREAVPVSAGLVARETTGCAVDKSAGKLRWFPAALATAFAAAAAVALAFLLFRSAPSDAAASLVQVAETSTGGFEKMTLPDGSVISLNTATAVEVAFDATLRRVTLSRGEASFSVAKDAARPFVVRARGVDVRAIGTVFNVRLQPELVEVLVTEGKVEVKQTDKPALAAAPRSSHEGLPPGDEPIRLSGGQRVLVSFSANAAVAPRPTAAEVTADETSRMLAWQKRRLEFSGESLAKVAAEFNRYNRHTLRIADARLAGQRFGGKFPVGDYESFVRLLETNFGVIADRRENETILRLGP